jgi:hypothetical protein
MCERWNRCVGQEGSSLTPGEPDLRAGLAFATRGDLRRRDELNRVLMAREGSL